MIIRASYSNLRFYAKDGWTREILESCLNEGEISARSEGEISSPFPYDENKYFIINSWGHISFEKLIEYATAIAPWGNNLPLILGREEILSWMRDAEEDQQTKLAKVVSVSVSLKCDSPKRLNFSE